MITGARGFAWTRAASSTRSTCGRWKMGADVWVCGPPTLIPTDIRRFGVRATSRVDEAVADADVIMLLRIQLERMEGAFFPSLREVLQRVRHDRGAAAAGQA